MTPKDVQNAVDKYLESNTIDGIFTPNNLVLYEEVDEPETITTDAIIGEVLAKLELRQTRNQALGLYLGDTLINSILLMNFGQMRPFAPELHLRRQKLPYMVKRRWI